MTRYEAHIEKDWQEHGMAQLLVVRKRSDGSADIGIFLVDVWCLGVKDAFGEMDVTEAFVDELIEERVPESARERIHPACAKKLIEGAIAYAETLGFAPHRDYRKARKVLSGIDASLCPTEYTFGRDGRPCFMRGPDDSDERVERVRAMLEARCGEEGYDLIDALEDDEAEPDITDLREDLMDWLDAEPDDVPRFYAFSGMVTALQICPQMVPPSKLLALFWGPEGRPWRDEAEVREFMSLLMSYWNYVSDLVANNLAPDAGPEDQAIDVWIDDFDEEYAVPLMAATIEWATGFMQTTKFWPESWGEALTRPDLAEHWEVVRWWAEFIGTGNKDRIADAAEADPPRNIALSITAIARAVRPKAPREI